MLNDAKDHPADNKLYTNLLHGQLKTRCIKCLRCKYF